MWKQLHQNWKRTKSFIGHAHKRVGSWLGDIDRLAGIGRRAFALAAPIMDDFGQGETVKKGMQAASGYDKIRKSVMDADSYAREHAGRIDKADLF